MVAGRFLTQQDIDYRHQLVISILRKINWFSGNPWSQESRQSSIPCPFQELLALHRHHHLKWTRHNQKVCTIKPHWYLRFSSNQFFSHPQWWLRLFILEILSAYWIVDLSTQTPWLFQFRISSSKLTSPSPPPVFSWSFLNPINYNKFHRLRFLRFLSQFQ